MKNLKITVNGVAYDVQVEEVGGDSVSAAPAAPAPAAPKAPAAPAAPKAPVEGETVNSPMPGTVLDVQIKPGDYVKVRRADDRRTILRGRIINENTVEVRPD